MYREIRVDAIVDFLDFWVIRQKIFFHTNTVEQYATTISFALP